jgi:mono/diheme cytochrome c family protein
MNLAPHLFLVVLALGCADGQRLQQTGSQTLVGSSDGRRVFVVNSDEDSISAVSVRDGSSVELAVGEAPARISRDEDRLYVTVAGTGELVKLIETETGARELARVTVGGEPFGVVASHDGASVYVAVSLEDRVEERDAVTLDLLREWAVPDQPRWLALHPLADALFVVSTFAGGLTRIDLASGRTSSVDPPVTTRAQVPLALRFTGDPGITSSGDELAVPGLYLDITTPVVLEETEEGSSGGYGSASRDERGELPLLEVDRLNAVLVTFPLDPYTAELRNGGQPILLGVRDIELGRIVRSMPSAAVADPYEGSWIVPLEGSDVLLAVDRRPYLDQGPLDPVRVSCAASCDADISVAEGGFWERPTVVVNAPGGPRGVAFVRLQSAWVHSFLDRTVSQLAMPDTTGSLGARSLGTVQAALDTTDRSAPLAATALAERAEAGRRLFVTAVDPKMAAPSSGISCATCHLGGRTDGLVWPLPEGPRNTPSLAGPVGHTAPYTWTGAVDSVATEADITSQTRMGGTAITWEDLDAIEQYVTSIRAAAPVVSDADVVARGGELFVSAGCGTCHSGSAFTDNQFHDILGMRVQAPTLRGVAGTAPYYYNGRAATLAEVLETPGMGTTGLLEPEDAEALEAYLRSL